MTSLAPRLLLSSEWTERYFDKTSAPDPRTVRGWVEKQLIPGRIIGQQTYIDIAAWLAQSATDALPIPRRTMAYRA